MANHLSQPDPKSDDWFEDLISLVAGTLDEKNFVRVSRAVAASPLLRERLHQIEQIREGIVRGQAAAENLSLIAATQATVLNALAANSRSVSKVSTKTNSGDSTFFGWLKKLSLSGRRPSNASFAYGVVVVQAALIAALTLDLLPRLTGNIETSVMRGSSPSTDNKQLGTQQDNIFLTVSFAASTPESTFRALLLEIQADIVSGPNQLGQYRISVARNRSYLAQLKLREAEFVEQVLEVKP